MTSPVQLDTPTDARSLAFQAANARYLETVATNDDYRDYYREDDPPAAPPGSDRPVRTEMPPKSRRILDRVRLARPRTPRAPRAR